MCSRNEGLKADDPLGIFLIDHAWTYRLTEARKHLSEIDGLALRMKCLMNLQVDADEEISSEEYKNKIIEDVIENMWKYNQTYNITTEIMVS